MLILQLNFTSCTILRYNQILFNVFGDGLEYRVQPQTTTIILKHNTIERNDLPLCNSDKWMDAKLFGMLGHLIFDFFIDSSRKKTINLA